jgi:hypothetical protein
LTYPAPDWKESTMFANNDRRTPPGDHCRRLKRPYSPSDFGRRLLSGLVTLALIGSLLLTSERPARAYVDPGSGFLAFQLIGAWLAGGLFVFRRKFQGIVTKRRGDIFGTTNAAVARQSQTQQPTSNQTGQAEI